MSRVHGIHQTRANSRQVNSKLLLPNHPIRISRQSIARRDTNYALHRRHSKHTILRRVDSTLQQMHQVGQRMATTDFRGHRRPRGRIQPTPRTRHRTIVQFSPILSRVVNRLINTAIRLLVIRLLQTLGRHRYVQTRLHLHFGRAIRNLQTQVVHINSVRNIRRLHTFIHQRSQRLIRHPLQNLLRHLSRLFGHNMGMFNRTPNTSQNRNLRTRSGTFANVISIRRRQMVTTPTRVRRLSTKPASGTLTALIHHTRPVIRRYTRR